MWGGAKTYVHSYKLTALGRGIVDQNSEAISGCVCQELQGPKMGRAKCVHAYHSYARGCKDEETKSLYI